MIMVMPVIGGAFAPTRVRLMLAVGITAAIAPVLGPMPPVDLFSLSGLLVLCRELLVGLVMGFAVQLVFDAIALGGQVIAMSMGLGFAVFVDRQRGVNIPVLSQLFMILGMLLFLAMDGHLAMIRLLAESFRLLPVDGPGLSTPAIGAVLGWVGHMFSAAVKIALPAITALIIVNLSFGVMSRAAPTLNLFAVGFPVAMLLGFVVIFLSMESLLGSASELLRAVLEFLPGLFRN